MLDTDTKRRIDSARDILVGKVPDPKSQVEQITIALIYKFMDDMDAESEDIGGIRSFFAGEFESYGWAKLMRSGLSGHEILTRYADAIGKMPENPGIPQLFRDIFKNAYLPYRDPETLRAFLKVIDEFTYDNSESLGDAFEYLLSVLGSQGDAGQFRTPRHIIEFMVALVNPQKHETVLDPACGTAGFLISSYKHILRQNCELRGGQEIDKPSYDAQPVNTLTPEERGQLATNFKGYDISPDMVRLSLVNLYLHGFVAPQIYEYDTLTSQERWNDYADVILANPPFMSPKGGIKPHNRFSVQSKRSEVLFVDYMAEHLTPNGRAAIIVPEGIIFQSHNAYKQLRKLLVDKYLIAVISLPAGVFQPYSGVKTSILLLHPALAKKSDTIAFFKVENDGFGLGAQRRAVVGSDLPAALAAITNYELGITNEDSSQLLIVPKSKIAANGDYNLSGDRYYTIAVGQTSFPMVALGDIADLLRGITFGKSDQLEQANENSLLVVTTKAAQECGIIEDDLYHIPRALLKDDNKLLRSGDILISTANSLNLLGRTTHVKRINRPMSFGAFMSVIRPNTKILDAYLIRLLRTQFAHDFYIRNANTTTNISNLNLSTLAQLQIPLPPLAVQQELVTEIEQYQKVIDGARAVVDNYRPRIVIDPEWPVVELGDICTPEYGFTEKATDCGDSRFIRITDIAEDGTLINKDEKFITLTDEAKHSLLKKGDILVARTGATYGKTMIFSENYTAVFASYLIRLKFSQQHINPSYYWVFAQGNDYRNQAKALMTGGGQPQFNGNALKQVKIPLPPLATQQAIVAEIEAEQALVNNNRELITRFENKIQAVLKRITN